jgi:RNA polymerase sigma-70 factor (ECF subfamily)
MSVNAQRPSVAPDAEAIWQEFHESLLGFIDRRVRSHETAEDILQHVMLRIHRHAPGVERAEAVGAWVHEIARNAIADHYRSARVRRELAAGIDLDQEPAGEPEAEAPDLRSELAACIAPLLKRLPPIYRQALTLTEVEGLTQAEAAARVGISPSGMKSRVQRARRKLKRVLTDCCEVELDRRRSVTNYRPRRASCDCGAD